MKRTAILFVVLLCLLCKASFAQTITYNYTGSVQTYTVPFGVASLAVQAYGARGGYNCNPYLTNDRPGYGASVVCTLAVTTGQVLRIYAGGAGGNGTITYGGWGGYNGGGSAGFAATTTAFGPYSGGGGGGASDIRTSTSLASRVVVAAGGGGAGADRFIVNSERGGDGGGTTGEAGFSLGMAGGTGTGSGGTQTLGGGGGTYGCAAYPGLSGTGGNACSPSTGGGGGGGYWGGGGGVWKGGGGGSSYADPALTSGVIHTRGADSSDNGKVIITAICNAGTIVGTLGICHGTTTTLTDAVPGGSWTSSTPSIATIGASSGLANGVAVGTATITYTVTLPCGTVYTTANLTVNPYPSPISSSSSICIGTISSLSATPSGGTWTSVDTTVGRIEPSSGTLTGMSGGVTAISYVLPAGCYATTTVSVNPLMAAISGVPRMCAGATTTLTDTASGGTWSSNNPAIATVGSGTGIVTGIAAGTTTITYTIAMGCMATYDITVNPLPVAITGAATLCDGQTTTLSSSGAGRWSSGTPGVATIGSTTGYVATVSAGTVIMTFTLATGCLDTFTLTVNPNPLPVTGSGDVCTGAGGTLSDATSGGIWTSSNPALASIDASTGVYAGISAGSVNISYTLGTGCNETFPLNINPLPGTIMGAGTVCAGTNGYLYNSGGGTWISSDPSTATIGLTTGMVTGLIPGVTTITYTLPTGCLTTKTVTVDPPPGPISGAPAVCIGLTTTLSDTSTTGTWSSSSPWVATISSTGTVTGITTGSSFISYTLPTGCFSTYAVAVNSSPAPIDGPSQVCIGSTIALSDTVTGGIWSSGAPVFATVGSGTGIVTGHTAGFVTITYSMGVGCMATKLVTVNPLPSAIAGPGNVCVNSTVTLSASGSGTWSSGTPSVATTGATTGAVSGISSGTSVITYALATGCQRTKTITVDPLPAPITGLTSVCVGSSITLSDVTSGGAWSCSPLTTGTITPVSGIFTGIASGVASVTYTIAGGCNIITTRTVNALPISCSVTGGGSYCSGGPGVHIVLGCSAADARYQLYLGTAATGAPVAGTGFALDFGSYTVAGTYTVAAVNATTGCTNNMTGSAVVAVNPLPAPITGPTALCAASVITLTNASVGGTWSGSNPGTATIGVTSGVVTGIATGITTISYTLPTGCKTGTVVTVSLSPGAISGPSNACPGFTTVPFTNGVSGGVWTSGTTSVAMIGSLSGIVTGVATGTTIITYSLGSGCTVTKTVSVTPLPGSIAGSNTTCVGSTTMLSNSTPLGRWSSGATGIATVGSATGIVSGISPGTATIYYTLGTGCAASSTVTVNPVLSSISGTLTACVGSTTLLSNPIPGGTWSSGSPIIATVGSGSGVVTGMSAGTSMITYTLSPGCSVSIRVTINPLPAVPSGAGSGGTNICIGGTTTLTDATPGGVWSSGTPAIAAIGSATGIVNGLTGGAATISYTITTGCVSTAIVTVVDVPPIAGVSNMCAWGDTIHISNTYTAGIYGSSLVTVLNLGGGNGIVTAFAPGVATISYTLSTIGCVRTATLTVNPLPGLITGMLHLCAGATTTLGNAVSGGTWSSYSTPVATIGSTSGYVAAIATGTTRISYALSTGCKTDTLVTVSTVPNAGSITGPDNVCTGQSIVLTDSIAGGTWHSSSAAATVLVGVVTGVSAGTNTISYTVTNICGSATAVKSITINPMPDAGVITGIDSVCVGNIIMLINAATGGVWSCTNPLASISTSGVLSGLTAGTDTVLYSVSDGSCTSTAIFPIKILPLAVCGSLETPDITPGNTSITIYPNPNDGVFLVKGSLGTANDEEVSLEITNITGQLVYEEKIMAKKGKLDALVTTDKTLANGMYMLTLRSENVNKVSHIVIAR